MGKMRFLSGAALIALTLLASACGEKKTESKPIIRPVRVSTILEAGAQRRQTLAGVARSSQEMALSFRVSGALTELKAKLGDDVKQGDVLARLDSKDAGINIQRAKASVARADAEHRSAAADFERVKLLYTEGSASRSDLDAARALEESKRAMLSAEKKGLEMENSKLSDHVLKAPLDGAIAAVEVEVNENVQSGQAIAVLNAGEKAEIEVAVPERMIEFFHRGAPATVVFDAIEGAEFEGTVSEVGVSSAASAAGFPVRVALLKPDKRIKAGMSALVSLQLGDKESAARIYAPPAAVLEDAQKKRYVMLAVPAEKGFATVKRQDVTIGEPTSMGIVVGSGLKGGEAVIVAGLSKITEGMKVRLLTKKEPALAEKRLAEPQ